MARRPSRGHRATLRPGGVRAQRYPDQVPDDRGATTDRLERERESQSDWLDKRDQLDAAVQPDDPELPQRRRLRTHGDLVYEVALSVEIGRRVEGKGGVLRRSHPSIWVADSRLFGFADPPAARRARALEIDGVLRTHQIQDAFRALPRSGPDAFAAAVRDVCDRRDLRDVGGLTVAEAEAAGRVRYGPPLDVVFAASGTDPALLSAAAAVGREASPVSRFPRSARSCRAAGCGGARGPVRARSVPGGRRREAVGAGAGWPGARCGGCGGRQFRRLVREDPPRRGGALRGRARSGVRAVAARGRGGGARLRRVSSGRGPGPGRGGGRRPSDGPGRPLGVRRGSAVGLVAGRRRDVVWRHGVGVRGRGTVVAACRSRRGDGSLRSGEGGVRRGPVGPGDRAGSARAGSLCRRPAAHRSALAPRCGDGAPVAGDGGPRRARLARARGD